MLYTFIHDAKRFLLYNRSMIEKAPLQTYCSALIFAPEDSVVRKQFENHIPSWICKKPRVQAKWNATLQTLEGHSSWVNSVAFSPDGKLVASGSWRQHSQALGRRHGSGAADARGPFGQGQLSSILAGRQAGGVGLVRQHSQALGRRHGSGAADARGPFELGSTQ